MMAASGARKVRIGLNYGAHAMGSCRMGDDPRTSVVNEFGQAHDIPNLFICRHQRLRDRLRREPHAHRHGHRQPRQRAHCRKRPGVLK